MNSTNPVEQRIEKLADKWIDVMDIKPVRVVRLLYKNDEAQMADAFVWYMLGLDSKVQDIAFILDPVFVDKETYSEALLNDLQEVIREWNETPKPDEVEDVPVEWKADLSLADKENKAALFVSNFNQLAEVLNLEDGRFVVASLFLPHDPRLKKEVVKWVEAAIEEGISPRVKFLIQDIEEHSIFGDLATSHGREVYTLVPDFDMDNVMNQVASMGDPNDPGTLYRISFVDMMQSMQKKNSKKALSDGETCIRIAKENEPNDPHWGIQIVVVNLTLANDQLGAKNFNKAIKFAEKGIDVAEHLSERLDPSIRHAIAAQAYMTKASIYCYPKNWKKALEPYTTAAELYILANNSIMAIEAYRMAGFCASKLWESDKAAGFLAKGFLLGESLAPEILQASTYSALIKQLLEKEYSPYVSHEEIDRIATAVYGEEWEKTIHRLWKEAPDAATTASAS